MDAPGWDNDVAPMSSAGNNASFDFGQIHQQQVATSMMAGCAGGADGGKETPQVTDPKIIQAVQSRLAPEMGKVEKVFLPDEELCAESVSCMRYALPSNPCCWPCLPVCGPILCCIANKSEKKWKVYKYFITDKGLGRVGYDDQPVFFKKHIEVASAVWTTIFSTDMPCYTRRIYGIRFHYRKDVEKSAFSNIKSTTWMVRRNVLGSIYAKMTARTGRIGAMLANMGANMNVAGSAGAPIAATMTKNANFANMMQPQMAYPAPSNVTGAAGTTRVIVYLETLPDKKCIVHVPESSSWEECIQLFKAELELKDPDARIGVFLAKGDAKIPVYEPGDLSKDDILMIASSRPAGSRTSEDITEHTL
mmetsp:Transcript_13268/g.21634  ORF Transcript_13268/g.21634 Transcript_13268/m.21634 type:complete len:363 (-) Transcript_13268:135-1223(-)|eukprot:CAMPEP_0203786056 /NCGR_PEP_ID=MMETSP0100_2-20121128/1388_1 /ASSEMBLY_ACC=CAM_ASM_000210 /TAXON_ID=96639 /ORGANISM=" , Strain NY0313808BC1" /LENGTH=362 /DNA_ID=CAMNT_0050688263 /DNA_START=80 /DNA_END=1168 /DNA_ORIENTATION=-